MSKTTKNIRKRINLVWLKRDLRLQDHLPFHFAEKALENYLPIYIFEPSAIDYPDCSLRHLQFVYHSIREMNNALHSFQKRVIVFHTEALEVFHFLSEQFEIRQVFSYQESGVMETWKRDKAVAVFFKQQRITWHEFQRDGVARGIKNREYWDKQWYAAVYGPIIKNTFAVGKKLLVHHPFELDPKLEGQLQNYPNDFQRPGEQFAWKYLRSFCQSRGRHYNQHISKPLESRKSCGRISPYLAWGNLSIRQAYQFVKNHPNYPFNKRSFNGLLTRLQWHCHFIQKFENECDYETTCVNRGYELLEYENNPQLIEAWKNGQTGFPLVDACMRCLHTTGWINFRMRAMLVSLLTLHFDCDWRKGVYHLAKLFLDYEPGIHYPQFQMQAGTTGVNTVRMYNPIKQSQDHDREGVFIKTWVPELKNVPVEFIHEPWKMTDMDKAFHGVEIDYPAPVIDLTERGKIARKKIWGHRNHPTVKAENQRIIVQHVRQRKSSRTAKKSTREKSN